MKENVRRREAEEKQRKARIAKEKAEREKQDRQMRKKRLLEVNTGEMFIRHSLKVFTRVSFRQSPLKMDETNPCTRTRELILNRQKSESVYVSCCQAVTM